MFYLLAYIIRGGINRHRQKDQNFHCNKELFHAPNKINIDKEQKKKLFNEALPPPIKTKKPKLTRIHNQFLLRLAKLDHRHQMERRRIPPAHLLEHLPTPRIVSSQKPLQILQIICKKKKKPPPKPPEAQIQSQTTQSKNQTNRTQKPQSTRAKPTKAILALGVPNDGPRLVLVGDAEAGADDGESFHVHLLRRAAGVRRQRLGEEMPKKMAPFWAAMDTCVPAILTMGARAKETRTCGSGRAVRNRGRSG